MFGESESESPRVGSPWESFISTPSPATATGVEAKARLGENFPKLAPEVEYGNVEYKLKLVNPSPERFLRLVTQMKWRLLEGGGQAYYELGVADSGHLVGLSRKELEQSLETLEMMAGDIGASVIIVKEVEVPAALVGRGLNVALGIPRRTPVRALALGEPEISTNTETETSATEDDEELFTECELKFGSPLSGVQPLAYGHTHFTNTRTQPEHQAFPSSPIILPSDLDADPLFHSDFEIEIASVYKPRPHRSRPAFIAQSKYTKRGAPIQLKKQQHPRVELDPHQRAEEKRMKRDARRDARHKALLMPNTGVVDTRNESTIDTVRGFEDLHVGLESVLLETQPNISVVSDLTKCDGNDDVDEDTMIVESLEPRLIVEVLVVRKLALEEAFLDFGGFALEI